MTTPAESPNLLKPNKFISGRYYDGRPPKDPEVVIVDNEPLIKLYSNDSEPELISFERLQFLDSDLLDYGSWQGPTLFEKLLVERVRLGQEVILKSWANEGYTVSELLKEPKSKAVLGTLIPTLKNPEPGRNKGGIYKGIMKFVQEDGDFYWALMIKEDKTVLGKVAWNDYPGIERLAKTCLDRESVGVVFSLTDPRAASSLVESKKQKAKEAVLQKITKRYFEEAVFSTADKASVIDLIAKYNSGIDIACKRTKQVEYKNLPHFVRSAKPIAGELGLYPDKRRDVVEMQFYVGVQNEYSQYVDQTTTYKGHIRSQEKILWAKFKKDALALGFIVTESSKLSAINQWLAPTNKAGAYTPFYSFRSFTVIRNEQKHKEVFRNNKTEADLHAYVKKKNGVQATSKATSKK